MYLMFTLVLPTRFILRGSFDESNKQLVAETLEPLPAEPGKPERYDYQYERNFLSNLFMFFEPLGNWRHLEVTDRSDYAKQMK